MKKSFYTRNLINEESGRGFTIVIVLLLMLAISGNKLSAAVITQEKDQKENSRMILLEKLEGGQKLTSEEIRAGLNPSYEDDDILADFELPEIPDFPEFPRHPEIWINPPHIYINTGNLEFDEKAVRELKEDISRSLGEMKKEIESVINSEEMMNFHKEMKEWGEEIRREVEKAVREIKTEKEITLKIEGIKS